MEKIIWLIFNPYLQMSTYLELPMNRINLLRLTKVHNKAYAQLKRRKHVKD